MTDHVLKMEIQNADLGCRWRNIADNSNKNANQMTNPIVERNQEVPQIDHGHQVRLTQTEVLEILLEIVTHIHETQIKDDLTHKTRGTANRMVEIPKINNAIQEMRQIRAEVP